MEGAMPINAEQLRTLVVQPVLAALDLSASDVAENLIMGTAAHESHLGDYIKQVGGGPDIGIFQCKLDASHGCKSSFLGNNTLFLCCGGHGTPAFSNLDKVL
eukprot:TRINITY_DN26537_c0_g1_i1.p3 TRINITY_DN26537_c0_g1~~TRINITY_DN26537_c0_g1_i1.p3  ORF type:complete len:102 (-),score=2.31 TRINITY_DN26537_c0_g1_i1:1187-1492(-)